MTMLRCALPNGLPDVGTETPGPVGVTTPATVVVGALIRYPVSAVAVFTRLDAGATAGPETLGRYVYKSVTFVPLLVVLLYVRLVGRPLVMELITVICHPPRKASSIYGALAPKRRPLPKGRS